MGDVESLEWLPQAKFGGNQNELHQTTWREVSPQAHRFRRNQSLLVESFNCQNTVVSKVCENAIHTNIHIGKIFLKETLHK